MASTIHSKPGYSSLSDWEETSDPAQQVTVLAGSDATPGNDSSDGSFTTSHESWIDGGTADTIRLCLLVRDEKIAKLQQELREKAASIDMLKRKLRLEKDHYSRTIALQEQETQARVDVLAREHAAELRALNRDWEIEYRNQTRYFEDRLDSPAIGHEAEPTTLDPDWEIECADPAQRCYALLAQQAAAYAEQHFIRSRMHELNSATMAVRLRNQEAWYEAELERRRARHEVERGCGGMAA